MQREKIKNLLIGAVICFFFLFILEAIFRLFSLSSLLNRNKKEEELIFAAPAWMRDDPNTRERVIKKKIQLKKIDWLDIFEEGDGFRVRLKPRIRKVVTNTFSLIPQDSRYYIKANSFGFRGEEFALKKPKDAFRIAVFGDSSSFGWGVNNNETFSYLLQKALNRKPPIKKKFEVINLAMPGDSSEYGKLIFDHFFYKIKPDLIILGFGANDAKYVSIPHKFLTARFLKNKGLLKIRHFMEQSELFRVMELALQKLYASAGEKPLYASLNKRTEAVSKKGYRKNLEYMGEKAAQSNSKVLLLTLCVGNNYARSAYKTAKKKGYVFLNGQQLLMKALPLLQEGFIYQKDLRKMRESYSSYLNKRSLFYITSDLCHPNRVGHKIIAEALFSLISSQLRGNNSATYYLCGECRKCCYLPSNN